MCPDHRSHRGPHPDDAALFAASQWPLLRQAVQDLAWLLTRGYAAASSLKLVGDRYNLRERQRVAVMRSTCAEQARSNRAASCLAASKVTDKRLVVDGFNLLITIEAGLGGGILLEGRDECIRDLASVHGTYRAVEETDRALLLVGKTLQTLRPASVHWLFDSPISNSGRISQRVRELAEQRGWSWTVQTVFNPDREIPASDAIAVTSDAMVLDAIAAHGRNWVNLVPLVLQTHLTDAAPINLRV